MAHSNSLGAARDKRQARTLLLDCSLRDGGYVNNWDFPLDLVQRHIESLNELKVPLVEVGFRSSKSESSRFEGLMRHCPPSLLVELKNFAPDIRLGVMINAADFSNADEVHSTFKADAESEALSFVRIATLADACDVALGMVERLADLGFGVFLNIMQSDALDTRALDRVLRASEESRLEGLYFADTFGAMRPENVESLMRYVSSRSPLQLGGHFHDNLGLAFANSLSAIIGGASLIDATVMGIGRGAGNAQLEQLLLEHITDASLPVLAELIHYWRTWAEQPGEVPHSWGPSLEYALAARKGVHPTYVQRLSEAESHSPEERVAIITELGSGDARAFAEQAPEVGNEWFDVVGRTDPELPRIFENKRVLLVGGGSSTMRYAKKIHSFSAREDSITILIGSTFSPHIDGDFRLVSDPATILARGPKLFQLENLLAPFSQIPVRVAGADSLSRPLGFGVNISEQKFGLEDGTLFTFSSRSSICALALLCGAKPYEILFAGFDGYKLGDTRNVNFARGLEKLATVHSNTFSLTPSQYNFRFLAES